MHIHQVVSELISVSVSIAEVPGDQKLQKLASLLLEDEKSILRTPPATSLWKSVCRFLRHTFYSRKVCQQKELQETLLCLSDTLSHTSSLSYTVTKDEYQKLCAHYHGDGKEALLSLTTRLLALADSRFHSQELHRAIERVARSVPQELLPCPERHKSLFYEAKKIAESIFSIATLEEIQKTEERIAVIQQKLGAEDYSIMQEIEQIRAKLKDIQETIKLRQAEKALDQLERELRKKIETEPLGPIDLVRELERSSQHDALKQKKEAIELRLMGLYLSTIETYITKETDALLKALESADLITIAQYRYSFDWIQKCIESQVPRNKAASQVFQEWQNRCQKNIQQTISKINETLTKKIEKEKAAIKKVVEAPQTNSCFTEATAHAGWTTFALGTALSAGGWYIGAGNHFATACKVDSVSASIIGASVAYTAFVAEGLFSGLPLTYAAANGTANLLLPTLASGVSFMGLSLGPIQGCATLFVIKDPIRNLFWCKSKLAWMGDTKISWLLAAGAGGVKYLIS